MKHVITQSHPTRMSLLTVLTRKPAIFFKWLIQAREMQIAIFMIAVLLLAPLFLPPLLDPALESIFPPVAKKRLLGLVSGVTSNPNLDTARTILQASMWLIWSGLLVFILWRKFPGFASYANQYSRTKEEAADNILEQRPGDSLLLYSEALQWALDPEHEAALSQKIEGLNTQFVSDGAAARQSIEQTVAISPTATVVISDKQSVPDSNLIGARYQLIRRLGEGAMGIVYLAHDKRLGRDVAIKQLSPSLIGNEELLARFRQEAKALARLVHPNIVQAYDFIEDEHKAWITMEYIEGQDLDSILTDEPMHLQESMDLAKQIATAMAYAHSQGVVHRDLKPANILISTNGVVKIMDFGVAKLNESSMMTRVGTIMGSPAFMSPEQASGNDVGSSTDIYALGIILYRMLTGQYPFKGDAKSIIAQHLTRIPDKIRVIRPNLPEDLETLISQMLEKNPNNRPPSMEAIITGLELPED